jgi:hypothetical protein
MACKFNVKVLAVSMAVSLICLSFTTAASHASGPGKTVDKHAPVNKSADYVITFFNSNSSSVSFSRQSYTCMYNAGDESFTLNANQPKTETIEDKNSGLDCAYSWKAVVWNVSGAVNGGPITFYHALESGVGSSWITMVKDGLGIVKSATCYTGDNETPHDCLNKNVENVVALDIVI